MPVYAYTARASDGNVIRGESEGANESAVAQQLRAQNVIPLTIGINAHAGGATSSRQHRPIPIIGSLLSGVPLKERMIFVRNLGVMVGSGLSVARAVVGLSEQTKNANLKKALGAIAQSIQNGKSLSESMALHPAVFSELFVNMVRVGEVSGTLEETLNLLATQLEKDNEVVSRVRGAMTYPLVVIVAMIGIGILMLTFIIPKITSVFVEMNVELPVMTKIIVAISDAVRFHFVSVMLGVMGIGIGVRLFAATALGAHFFASLVLKLPVIGTLVMKVNVARFARIYGSLIKSGVSVVEALAIIARTLGNVHYKEALLSGSEAIARGETLPSILHRSPHLFPPLVVQMTEVGEETGKTDTMLLRVAAFYEDDVAQATKNLSSIIEPVLMIVIGVGVGFFAVAMLQPMYSIMEKIQ